MTDRKCKYRSAWWQVWKPKRNQWYGGLESKGTNGDGVLTKATLYCGCGCNTPHPDNGKWVQP